MLSSEIDCILASASTASRGWCGRRHLQTWNKKSFYMVKKISMQIFSIIDIQMFSWGPVEVCNSHTTFPKFPTDQKKHFFYASCPTLKSHKSDKNLSKTKFRVVFIIYASRSIIFMLIPSYQLLTVGRYQENSRDCQKTGISAGLIVRSDT